MAISATSLILGTSSSSRVASSTRSRDEIVPLLHAEELFEAAPDPQDLPVIAGSGTPTLSPRQAVVGRVIAARRGR
jgi:hypothetical protein